MGLVIKPICDIISGEIPLLGMRIFSCRLIPFTLPFTLLLSLLWLCLIYLLLNVSTFVILCLSAYCVWYVCEYVKSMDSWPSAGVGICRFRDVLAPKPIFHSLVGTFKTRTIVFVWSGSIVLCPCRYGSIPFLICASRSVSSIFFDWPSLMIGAVAVDSNVDCVLMRVRQWWYVIM